MTAIPVLYRRVQRGHSSRSSSHAIASVVILIDGISHLQHDPHGIRLAFGTAEVLVSRKARVAADRTARAIVTNA